MKKFLLLTGISAISLATFADEIPMPVKLDDVFIQKLSPNGKYAVSNFTQQSITIFNLETGEKFAYKAEGEDAPEQYYYGLGKCISNEGIFVGGQTGETAEYWKNGKWYQLSGGKNSFINSANAISADGSRICGMIGADAFSYVDDVLMVVPCIWNAEGEGFGEPVVLPYPEFDFLGRVPQYVKATDMSADGKTVVGMVNDATGRFAYPIIYKEDEEGKWSYDIPHKELLMKEGFELPENPGDFKEMTPNYEEYMTPEEISAYNKACEDYYKVGDWDAEYPTPEKFMTPEMAEEYENDYLEYQEKYNAWQEKNIAFMEAYDIISEFAPSYQDNSVRISSDGLTYACTIQEGSSFPWGGATKYNVWVFDINTDKIVKYDQQDNICLSYLADGGIAVASTPVSFFMAEPSNSYVLKDGEITGMYDWMNSKVPVYASWMKENMVFKYNGYDEEGEPVVLEDLMTGRAATTPDLSVMALSVQNIGFPEDDSVWEDPDYTPVIGYGYIFNLDKATAITEIRPSTEGKIIYDLSGRRLKEASAPGIYIINGEKKVVR
ncbi:MAG: hypothetical protein K2N48_03035 [Muribaculaceae bacterium]|nr:hypothetical protein [Muribaculaceae bacterium]